MTVVCDGDGATTTPPVTSPEVLMVAAVLFDVLQIPPPGELLSWVVSPEQTDNVPVIGAGNGLTVTVMEAEQPVASIYVQTVVDVVTTLLSADTIPVDDPIVATEVTLLVHVPPGIASLRLVTDPAQTDVLPVMFAGKGFTVTTTDRAQVVGSVYIIVEVPPGAVPVITPNASIGATTALELNHVPPDVASVSAIVDPTHTLVGPTIGEGSGLTSTDAVA